MDSWLSSAISKLGVEDAEVFAEYLAGLLSDADPLGTPQDAREALGEAVAYLSEVAGLPVETLAVFSEALWHEWIRSCDAPLATAPPLADLIAPLDRPATEQAPPTLTEEEQAEIEERKAATLKFAGRSGCDDGGQPIPGPVR